MIDGRTRMACLIGKPVSHSLSPAMHNGTYEKLGINMSYMAFEIEPGRVSETLKGLIELKAAGTNVTIPLKEEAMASVDELDQLAKRAGAVNTIVIDGDRTKGYNTDVIGIKTALEELSPQKNSVLILGAGGVSRAAVAALQDWGFKKIYISSRSKTRSQTISEEMSHHVSIETLEWGKTLKTDLLINATPLGLVPWPQTILDLHLSSGVDMKVLDLVYLKEDETPLVKEAKSHGISSLGGEMVLAAQGAAAFQLFTGEKISYEVMMDILRKERRS